MLPPRPVRSLRYGFGKPRFIFHRQPVAADAVIVDFRRQLSPPRHATNCALEVHKFSSEAPNHSSRGS